VNTDVFLVAVIPERDAHVYSTFIFFSLLRDSSVSNVTVFWFVIAVRFSVGTDIYSCAGILHLLNNFDHFSGDVVMNRGRQQEEASQASAPHPGSKTIKIEGRDYSKYHQTVFSTIYA
jgi:hypothetical protein